MKKNFWYSGLLISGISMMMFSCSSDKKDESTPSQSAISSNEVSADLSKEEVQLESQVSEAVDNQEDEIIFSEEESVAAPSEQIVENVTENSSKEEATKTE